MGIHPEADCKHCGDAIEYVTSTWLHMSTRASACDPSRMDSKSASPKQGTRR